MDIKFRVSGDEVLAHVRSIIINLNFLIIFMVSGTVCFTTYKIVDSGQVDLIMKQMEKIPLAPWKTVLFSMIGFFLLLLFTEIFSGRIQSSIGLILYSFIEILLCFYITWALGFNSNSIFLLAITDQLRNRRNTKSQISIYILFFSLYIVTGAGIIQNYIRITPIQAYLTYYNRETRALIATVISILTSCHLLLFMFHLVFLMRIQWIENERILELNRKLDEANEQLKEYVAESEKMAETRERNRLAREIHDTLGHSLTGIIAGLDACKRMIDHNVEDTKEQLSMITEVARNGMKDIRRSVKALRPDALEEGGLRKAIEKVIKDMGQVSGADIVLEIETEDMQLQEDEEETIYRIVQESLTNAIRHGRADEVHIRIEKIVNYLEITIADNGIGAEEPDIGFGLRHMQERVEMLNGTLSYDGKNGFCVVAKIPIRWGR